MELGGDVPSAPDQKQEKIITALGEYKTEAVENRKSGMNPRDDKWQQNIDLYWNRHDFSQKAAWQSKNVMPDVPAYVDRFAAALKEALVSSPNGFYTVTDPFDVENDLTGAVKKMNDVWLSTSGRSQTGTPLDFATTFEDAVKMGAMTAMSSVVLWKKDVPGGRVAIETVDPRFVWLDHTYRGLYRIRRTEVDRADIARMVGRTTAKGKPLYNLDEMSRLVGQWSQDQATKAELSGTTEAVSSSRDVVMLDEYIATIVDDRGQLLMDNEVVVLADDKYLIRGPEKNPFTHGRDWLVYTPLMPVPLSPYGRTYMEDFGAVAKIFTDLTNLILDATYTSTMKAYVMVPSMLTDPTQMNSGIYPNKIFTLEEGYTSEEFAKALDLGSLDAGAVQVWDKIKNMLSDAAGMNEIGLGQLPDKTHIAATAVAGAQQSSSAILRSIAQTVETRYLDPLLDLTWKTGLQHSTAGNQRMANAVGPEMYAAIIARKREFISRPYAFQARGISALIQRQQQFQQLMTVMQVVAQDQNLLAAFMQRVDINRLIDLIFRLSNVDLSKLAPTQREQMIQGVTQPLMQGAANGTPSAAGGAMAGQMAQQLGVAR
jgi:hypothetical protein